MAAKKNLSIEEILAACRAADGDGSSAAAPTPAAEPEAPAAAASTPAAPAASGAKPSQSMSVEEMMAAARGQAAGGAAETAAATPAAPAAGGKKASQSMSVAEMLAAARGENAGGAPAAKKAPAGAAKAAAPAAKSAPSKKANPKTVDAAAGPRDTSSILAAARKADGDKRGPMSKAQAAELGKAPTKAKVAPPMPEKPAYAAPQAKAAPQEDRRTFFAVFFGSFLALGFTSLGLVSALWGLGLARFMFPNILTEPPSQFTIGFPADFPPDSVVTKFKAQFGVWVVNSEYEGQQQITALMSVCTHLGCTPNWLEGEQKFKCPCHGSGFYKDGINFEGPAPRPLERYAIKIADSGEIEIDKSKTFQQEMGDWTDPACFVPV